MQFSRINKLSFPALLFASLSTSCEDSSPHPHPANSTSAPSLPDIVMSSLFADISSVLTHDLLISTPTPTHLTTPQTTPHPRTPTPFSDRLQPLTLSILPTPIQSSATVILGTSPVTISVPTQDPSLPSCILDPEERNSPACLGSLAAMQHSATLTINTDTTSVERPLPTCTGEELYSCIFVPPNSTTTSSGSSLVASTVVLSSAAGRTTSSVVIKPTAAPSGSAVVVGLQSAGYKDDVSWVWLGVLGLLVGALGL